jgi:hypothetical protein
MKNDGSNALAGMLSKPRGIHRTPFIISKRTIVNTFKTYIFSSNNRRIVNYS